LFLRARVELLADVLVDGELEGLVLRARTQNLASHCLHRSLYLKRIATGKCRVMMAREVVWIAD
jgi:hypothetical protein